MFIKAELWNLVLLVITLSLSLALKYLEGGKEKVLLLSMQIHQYYHGQFRSDKKGFGSIVGGHLVG